MGEIYKGYGSVYHRRYFINALRRLYGAQAFEVKMPSAGRAAMRYQAEEGRYCLSLLYASPITRGAVEVIEDMPPLYNVPVKIHVPEKITRVVTAVSGEEIPCAICTVPPDGRT